MQDNQILLSVIIPTFNRKSHLQKNLPYHLKEFEKIGINFEIFIVDNASTDGTQDYIETYKNNKHIRYARRIQNFGPEDNGLYASRHAKGKYIVFVGDDDRLIVPQIAENLVILENNPDVGMLQAPWNMVTNIENPTEVQKSYNLDFDFIIDQGRHDIAIRLILEKNIHPEFSITRKEIINNSFSLFHPLAFWSQVNIARVLTKTKIYFSNKPYANVLGITGDASEHHGGRDVMTMWDRYRGGFEYLMSFAVAGGKINAFDQDILYSRIESYIYDRMDRAAHYNLNAKNWCNVYYLKKRIEAKSQCTLPQEATKDINALAAIEATILEASTFSANPVIIDDFIADEVLDLMNDDIKKMVCRLKDISLQDIEKLPFAYITANDDFPNSYKPIDGIYDLRGIISQFI